MPFIPRQVKPPAHVAISGKLPGAIAALLKHDAVFLHSSHEYVITETLRLAFRKDKELPECVDDRLVIEDTADLQLTAPNPVRFEAHREQTGVRAVTIRDLLSTLRHRPHRIVAGEVRGGEAFDLAIFSAPPTPRARGGETWRQRGAGT